MAGDYKVGDIVRLKSGGPKMTINKLEDWQGTQQANCEWFDGTKPMQNMFPLTSLEHYVAPGRTQAGGREPGPWS
jgi:uncharacterized protein YodC (DUF2158 family)